MISVQDLHKHFNRVTAVNGVSFEVKEGEILGFLGPNGAGKSTTMRMITGYTPPSNGTVVVNGADVTKDPLEVRRNIGYLPENTPLYLDMTVVSYLGFVAEVKKVPSTERGGQIREALEETGLTNVANRTIGKLSKGYRQRVGLAQALLGNPNVLILDEPTVGLDPAQIREIRELIHNMAGKRTVILSTHILPEVSMICDRVLIINHGEIVAADAVGELSRRMSGSQQIRLVTKAPQEEIRPLFDDLEGIQHVDLMNTAGGQHLCQIDIRVDADKDLRPDLVNRIVGKGWPLYEIRSMEPSLEDIFVQIVAGDKGGIA